MNLQNSPKVEWTVFTAALGILILVCAPLFAFPTESEQMITQIYKGITNSFGVVYLWGGAAVLIFCLWLAFSRFGNVTLGDPQEPPQFSNYSWISMLFCAGVATGILYWGSIEWTFYYLAPPFGIEPKSVEAIEWAATYGIFHWGPTGWAFYCLPALAIGHAYYCRKIPRIRVSSACHAVLGRQTDGALGKLFDLCFMIGLLGAAGTSLGFGTPMIAAGVSHIFGIEQSRTLIILISALCALIFATSVYLGLEKGIRRLSNINMGMTLVLLAFIGIVGPTAFILKMGTNSLGLLLQNFIRMHSWTDPLTDSMFVEQWTVFYWAWWIAVGPFMGIFIAQISRGRTFRQVVLGTLTCGSLGCAIYYIVLGNYALYLETKTDLSIVAVQASQGTEAAIIAVIASLPVSQVIVPFFCLISLVFLATTYDSASYALAASASRSLVGDLAPARWHRLFWALTLAILPTALLVGEPGRGSLRALQFASLIVSVPLFAIFIVMGVSLVRALRQDEERN
ncbi:MAG: BCCT family transporter [Pirellulaceae bacterium]|nr:BCCT family transporter [Pirellulaceae bacterium]